jgi:hypothetical protein
MLFFGCAAASATRAQENPYRFHELTLYVIPSPVEFDWSSPATLYESYRNGFISKFFVREKYLLGHMFVQLSSPLLPEPIYAGMSTISRRQQRQLVFRDKIGLGILGIGLNGKLETEGDLIPKIPLYSRRNSLAFITFRIDEEAAIRIIRFLDSFNSENDLGHIPSLHYGGAFWPLYEDEGAGCTAFGMALLNLAGIWCPSFDNWKVDVNIPADLVGGQLNPGNRVSLRDIRSAQGWHDSEGKENFDYFPFWIYEPNLIYKWILDYKDSDDSVSVNRFTVASAFDMPGLFGDFRGMGEFDDNPLFSTRTDENLFIRHFRYTNGLDDGYQSDYSEE